MQFPNPFRLWRRVPLGPPEPAPAPPARPGLPRVLAFRSGTLPVGLLSRGSGPGLDYTAGLAAVSADAARRLPVFGHVRASEVLFTVTPARNRGAFGLQARLTPMRFRAGGTTKHIRGRHYEVQRFTLDGREVLYVLTVCVPRFLDLPFREKLLTLFHELYHVGPLFDGDLRRHPGRCHVHTRSQKDYDLVMGGYVDDYLATGPDPDLLAFLRPSSAGLAAAFGRVTAARVPRPKMLPVRV